MSTEQKLKDADEAWRKYQAAPKFRHNTTELEGELERESYVYSTPGGAVELWRSPSPRGGYFGGVEVHSSSKLYSFSEGPSHTNCRFTPTGECWHDGSSMAFEKFEDAFDAPTFVKFELADWHAERIKPTTIEGI